MVYKICFTLKKENIHVEFLQNVVSIFGKALPIATKCSILDVAGVIKPLKHVPTWTACAENLIQVPGQR